MTYQCSNGHASADPDFCSECGLQLAAPAAAAGQTVIAAVAHNHGGESCPVCSEVRDDPSAQFCGVCGYDYVNKTGGVVPGATPAAVAAPPVPVAPPPVPSKARIDVQVVVNGTVLKYSFFDEENLIGRKSSKVAQSLGIEGDDAISSRHLLLTRAADGITVRDLGSTNGSLIVQDGVASDLPAGVEKTIKIGDSLRIGAHTEITVLAVVQ